LKSAGCIGEYAAGIPLTGCQVGGVDDLDRSYMMGWIALIVINAVVGGCLITISMVVAMLPMDEQGIVMMHDDGYYHTSDCNDTICKLTRSFLSSYYIHFMNNLYIPCFLQIAANLIIITRFLITRFTDSTTAVMIWIILIIISGLSSLIHYTVLDFIRPGFVAIGTCITSLCCNKKEHLTIKTEVTRYKGVVSSEI